MTSDDAVDRRTARLVVAAGLTMALGVALGAFGAHGLRDRLAPDLLVIYDTGVRYHLVHGLAALLVAMASDRVLPPVTRRRAGWSFLVGIALFSGSLYLLALTGVRALGAVTPLGGVAWIVAWLLVAFGARRR